MTKDPMTMTWTTSMDGMFKRKRGRPPKNRVIEVNFCLHFILGGEKGFACVVM